MRSEVLSPEDKCNTKIGGEVDLRGDVGGKSSRSLIIAFTKREGIGLLRRKSYTKANPTQVLLGQKAKGAIKKERI